MALTELAATEGRPAPTLVATDMVGSTGDVTHSFAVEAADVATALQRHQPTVVLCAWMSMGADWTAAIRATPSVREYLLIGEVDMGVSGRPWETWGVGPGEIAPYVRDGFERVPLGALAVLQIARSDTPHVRFHSHTVAFRRRRSTPHEEL